MMQYNYGYVYKVSVGKCSQPEVIGYYLLYENAVKARDEGPHRFIEPIKLADYGGQW